VVDHGFGLQTTYGHALQIFVKSGETVKRGQRIASVGNSGRSTGPHLHYGVSVQGRSVDPADFILD
jgi:murein DD-endopeptidase MepM/ murein hydrolase activator NlpD